MHCTLFFIIKLYEASKFMHYPDISTFQVIWLLIDTLRGIKQKNILERFLYNLDIFANTESYIYTCI